MAEAENVSWVKCSPEEFALLLKVRDLIVGVKTSYRGFEELRDSALKAGRFEAAESYSAIMKSLLEESLCAFSPKPLFSDWNLDNCCNDLLPVHYLTDFGGLHLF